MKKYLGILILIFSLFIFASCGTKKEPPKKLEPPGPKIGVQLSLVDKEVAEIIKKEMEKIAHTNKIQLLWKEPTTDVMTFEKNIKELKDKKVEAIIIQFLPGDLTLELSKELFESNIKILAVNTLPLDVPVDGYIAPDNFRLGQLQGQYLLEIFKEKNIVDGRVILYAMDQNIYSFSRMTEGLLSVLNPNTGVTVEIREIPLAGVKTKESKIEEELLKEGKVDAVVVQGSSLAAHAARILKNNSNTKDAITVGIGAGKEAISLIAEGEHNAEADPMPEIFAQDSLEAIEDLLKTDTFKYDTHIENGSYDIPAKILPVRLIKKENIFLLKDRYGNIPEEGKKNSEESNSESSSKQGSSSGENLKLKIKTKNGQTLDIDLPGEIEEMEIKKKSNKGN